MYPHYLPTPKDDQAVIMYRAGQSSVVEYIKAKVIFNYVCISPQRSLHSRARAAAAAQALPAPRQAPPPPAAAPPPAPVAGEGPTTAETS